MEQLQQQIDTLSKQVQDLQRSAIQVNFDPTTKLYLQTVINEQIALQLALQPTQTYSTSTPSGVAPTGSIWLYNSGTLATNAIYAYSGTAWVQIK